MKQKRGHSDTAAFHCLHYIYLALDEANDELIVLIDIDLTSFKETDKLLAHIPEERNIQYVLN